jgi:hypothetical protein
MAEVTKFYENVGELIKKSDGELIRLASYQEANEILNRLVLKYSELSLNEENFDRIKKARYEIRQHRYALDKIEKHNKDLLNGAKKKNGETFQSLVQIITPQEKVFDDYIKEVEEKKKKEKEEKRLAEEKRKAKIQEAITEYKSRFLDMLSEIDHKTSTEPFDKLIDELNNKIQDGFFQEFTSKAKEIRVELIQKDAGAIINKHIADHQEKLRLEKENKEKEDRLAQIQKENAERKEKEEAQEKENILFKWEKKLWNDFKHEIQFEGEISIDVKIQRSEIRYKDLEKEKANKEKEEARKKAELESKQKNIQGKKDLLSQKGIEYTDQNVMNVYKVHQEEEYTNRIGYFADALNKMFDEIGGININEIHYPENAIELNKFKQLAKSWKGNMNSLILGSHKADKVN